MLCSGLSAGLKNRVALIFVFAVAVFFLTGEDDLWASNANNVSCPNTEEKALPAEYFEYSDVTSDEARTSMAEIFEVSLNMIYPAESSAKDALRSSLNSLLKEGKEAEAATMIGEEMGSMRTRSMAYIGFYCRRALPYACGDLDERARFLKSFLKGYGKYGVLIISDDSIEEIRATGRKRGKFWETVEDGNVPSNKFERIYPASDAVYIPFSAGEVFIVDIVGSENGEAVFWKVLPDGINKKVWGPGKWEREVTVRGDKLY